MNQVETEQFVRDDRNDLLALLEMRFGEVPQPVQQQICRLQDLSELQRLMIAACNAVDWEVFIEELLSGQDSFKLTGERFNPLNQQGKEYLNNG
jgi:hypothetical protein